MRRVVGYSDEKIALFFSLFVSWKMIQHAEWSQTYAICSQRRLHGRVLWRKWRVSTNIFAVYANCTWNVHVLSTWDIPSFKIDSFRFYFPIYQRNLASSIPKRFLRQFTQTYLTYKRCDLWFRLWLENLDWSWIFVQPFGSLRLTYSCYHVSGIVFSVSLFFTLVKTINLLIGMST